MYNLFKRNTVTLFFVIIRHILNPSSLSKVAHDHDIIIYFMKIIVFEFY